MHPFAVLPSGICANPGKDLVITDPFGYLQFENNGSKRCCDGES
jgi:hypothetical protein